MSTSSGDGLTLRAHLESVAKQTGVIPEQLIAKPLRPYLHQVWSDFSDLSRGREQNGWGPSPLTWTTIWSWSQLKKIELSPTQLRLIMRLDTEYLSALTRAQEDGSG